jgi:hypothetical protein
MEEEYYNQVTYLGDKIDVEADDCFVVSHVVFGADETGIRVATSVGKNPLRRKILMTK